MDAGSDDACSDAGHRDESRHSGEWALVHSPNKPSVGEAPHSSESLMNPHGRHIVYIRSCLVYVSALQRVSLPRRWLCSPASRLTDYLANSLSIPPWDIHISTMRGPVGSSTPIGAALVSKETVELRRGPAPVAKVAQSRRTLWAWGRMFDGELVTMPRRYPMAAHSVVLLSMGDGHAACTTDAGLVLTWG